MKKTVFVYGVIAGVISGGVLMLSMPFYENGTLTFDNGAVVGYTSMVIALSVIYVAIRNFRDKHNGGKIGFGKSFVIGLLISLIASILYAAAWEVCYHTVAKDFMTSYSEHALNEYKTSGASEADIQTMADEMAVMSENYKNPFIRFPMTMIELLPVGVLISLLCAFILKKK